MIETLIVVAAILIFVLIMMLAVITYSIIKDMKRNSFESNEYKYYLIRVNKVGEIQMRKYNPGGGINYPKF